MGSGSKRLPRHERANTRKTTNPYKPSNSKKTPAVAAPPTFNDGANFTWSVNSLDYKHTDGWDWDLEPAELRTVLSLLCELSKLTWREVLDQTYNGRDGARRHKNKYQPTDSICAKAIERLEHLHVETEQMFRLRLNSNARIWGYVQQTTFHVIWYDRDHQICPVKAR